jgi:hypothetical protein
LITEAELHEAIAECQGQRNPNANTCLKLASYYTILENLRKERKQEERQEPVPVYSYAAAPEPKTPAGITYTSETEFGRAVTGKDQEEVMKTMDELMTTLQAVIPRLYEGVMTRII